MSLTVEERERFERDGFVGPFTYLEPDAMAERRALVERQIRERRGPAPRDSFESRHQDCPAVYAICAAPVIVDRVASVLGPDVVLWNSVLFCKEPGGREIP